MHGLFFNAILVVTPETTNDTTAILAATFIGINTIHPARHANHKISLRYKTVSALLRFSATKTKSGIRITVTLIVNSIKTAITAVFISYL